MTREWHRTTYFLLVDLRSTDKATGKQLMSSMSQQMKILIQGDRSEGQLASSVSYEHLRSTARDAININPFCLSVCLSLHLFFTSATDFPVETRSSMGSNDQVCNLGYNMISIFCCFTCEATVVAKLFQRTETIVFSCSCPRSVIKGIKDLTFCHHLLTFMPFQKYFMPFRKHKRWLSSLHFFIQYK